MMKLAFYRSKYGKLLDHVINVFSGRLGYSHVELVFSDGMFFSSSPRDGGVRFKSIDPDEQWDVIRLPQISLYDEMRIRRWCRRRQGLAYDWLGVLGFVLPTKPEQYHWFCSEICTAALRAGGHLGHVPPNKVSPNELWLIAKEMQHDTKKTA